MKNNIYNYGKEFSETITASITLGGLVAQKPYASYCGIGVLYY